MPTTAKLTLTLILATALIAGVSGCGEDRSNLLPGDSVDQIMSNLDRVEALVDQRRCFDALEATREVSDQVEALNQNVDPTLRRTLLDGVTQLVITVQDTCVEAEIEPTEPEAEPPVDEAPEDDPPEATTGQDGNQNGGGDGQGGGEDDGDGDQDGGDGSPTDPEPSPEPSQPSEPDQPGSGGVSPSTGGN